MQKILFEHNKEAVFKQFFENYYAPFCIYAKRYIDDKETREDIVSEVFATLWNNIDSFDLHSETAVAYIKICVKNSCLNHLKHQEHECVYAEFIRQKTPIYETETDSIYTLDEFIVCYMKRLKNFPNNIVLFLQKVSSKEKLMLK